MKAQVQIIKKIRLRKITAVCESNNYVHLQADQPPSCFIIISPSEASDINDAIWTI